MKLNKVNTLYTRLQKSDTTCKTCKHQATHADNPPCADCRFHSEWEPKEEKK